MMRARSVSIDHTGPEILRYIDGLTEYYYDAWQTAVDDDARTLFMAQYTAYKFLSERLRNDAPLR